MVYYRAGYHHGDARAALVRAAFNLARGGGPSTVTLRAAAREVGITAAAVYRHFTTVEELLATVKCRSLSVLAEWVDAAVGAVGGADSAGFSDPPESSDSAGSFGLAGSSDCSDCSDCSDAFEAGDAAALRIRVRAVAEAYVSFAREYPGLFAMACHGGVEAAVDLVTERLGGLPRGTGLAVWSAAHGVAALPAPEADQLCVLELVLAGVLP